MAQKVKLSIFYLEKNIEVDVYALGMETGEWKE